MTKQWVQIFTGEHARAEYDAVRRAIGYYRKTIAEIAALEDDTVPNAIVDVCHDDKKDVNDLWLELDEALKDGLTQFKLSPTYHKSLINVLKVRMNYLTQLEAHGLKYAAAARGEALPIARTLVRLGEPDGIEAAFG